MRRLPSLNALRAFEATARCASVTQASIELGVSHSAVSQQIKSLEEYFGQTLFIRHGRSVRPTEGAHLLLGELKIAFDRIATACDQFSSRNGKTTITVNATPSFAMRWLIPKSSQFQIHNPEVKVVVETSTSDGIDHLGKRYDFIFRRAPMERLDCKCQKIVDDHSTALMSPSPHIDGKEPGLLRHQSLLHLKSRPDAWLDWFKVCGVDLKETPPGPYYEHFFLSLQAAISGLGIAIGPLCLVQDDISSNRLVAPFPEHTLVGPGFHALYPSITLRSRPHRAFLDALLEAGRTDIIQTAM